MFPGGSLWPSGKVRKWIRLLPRRWSLRLGLRGLACLSFFPSGRVWSRSRALSGVGVRGSRERLGRNGRSLQVTIPELAQGWDTNGATARAVDGCSSGALGHSGRPATVATYEKLHCFNLHNYKLLRRPTFAEDPRGCLPLMGRSAARSASSHPPKGFPRTGILVGAMATNILPADAPHQVNAEPTPVSATQAKRFFAAAPRRQCPPPLMPAQGQHFLARFRLSSRQSRRTVET